MSEIQKLYTKGNLNSIEELIVRISNYAWKEMTLSQQVELREKAAAELAALEQRIATLEGLLKRIRQWDQLPEFSQKFGDGNYWMREIDAALQERKP